MHHADFAVRILREIDEAKRPTEVALLGGSFASIEEYRRAVGIRQGLERAREIVAGALSPEERQDAERAA